MLMSHREHHNGADRIDNLVDNAAKQHEITSMARDHFLRNLVVAWWLPVSGHGSLNHAR